MCGVLAVQRSMAARRRKAAAGDEGEAAVDARGVEPPRPLRPKAAAVAGLAAAVKKPRAGRGGAHGTLGTVGAAGAAAPQRGGVARGRRPSKRQAPGEENVERSAAAADGSGREETDSDEDFMCAAASAGRQAVGPAERPLKRPRRA